MPAANGHVTNVDGTRFMGENRNGMIDLSTKDLKSTVGLGSVVCWSTHLFCGAFHFSFLPLLPSFSYLLVRDPYLKFIPNRRAEENSYVQNHPG